MMQAQIALAVLVASPEKVKSGAPGKPRRFNRRWALIGGLLLCIGTLLAVTLSTAHAQGPTSNVQFVYVRDPNAHASPNAPMSSVTNLSYYGGPVMLTTTTYTIFWAPTGHSIPADYKNLINRFFSDVGGSNLYNVMTQYHDNSSHIQNHSTLGGTWVDTTPYPHQGTDVDPLRGEDIRAAVARAMAANGWTPGLSHLFFVYTAPNIAECYDAAGCTPGTPSTKYCVYHSWFQQNSQTVAYAFMPYIGSWGTWCRTLTQSPNNDLDADAVISLTSHELFSVITDPEYGANTLAWYDKTCKDNTLCGEVGDKCQYRYGTLAADGSNVILGAHRYIVQQEWSNANFTGASYSGCVLGYTPIPPTPTPPPPTPTPPPASAHVHVDQTYTAANKNGKLKNSFTRGAPIFYFASIRNDGKTSCATASVWFAQGGSKILLNLNAKITVKPGTSLWWVKGKVPTTAPLRTYKLTIGTLCNGQVSYARSKFQVVAGKAGAKRASDTLLPSGPFAQ